MIPSTVLSLICRSAAWFSRKKRNRKTFWFPRAKHQIDPMPSCESVKLISQHPSHGSYCKHKTDTKPWTFPTSCSPLQCWHVVVQQQRLVQPPLSIPAQLRVLAAVAAASSPSPIFSPVPPRPRSFGSVNSIPSHESVPFWNNWSRALIPPLPRLHHPHRHLLHRQSAFTLSVSTLASR